VRLRAQVRATLEVAPETDLDLRAKLQAEVSAERFTRIDRAMREEALERVLDPRPGAGQVHADFDPALRIGRLQTLECYGLAAEAAPAHERCRKNWSRRCSTWASAATPSRRSTARSLSAAKSGHSAAMSYTVTMRRRRLSAG
jgi:hypothetical protein